MISIEFLISLVEQLGKVSSRGIEGYGAIQRAFWLRRRFLTMYEATRPSHVTVVVLLILDQHTVLSEYTALWLFLWN